MRFTCLGFALVLVCGGRVLALDDISFHGHVLPILKKKCVGCHGGETPKGKLSLSTLDELLRGGKRGESVVASKPDESLLFLLSSRAKKPYMPPEGEEALSAEEVQVIRRWIEGGLRPGEPVPVAAPYSQPLVAREYRKPPVITALTYSRDGKRLYAAAYREIVVHEAEPGQGQGETAPRPLARLLGEAERLQALEVWPDGKRLLAVGGNPSELGEIQIWDLEKNSLEKFIRLGKDTIFCAAIAPDARRIVVGGTDRSIHVLDSETGKVLSSSELHSDWIFGVGIALDGTRVFSAGRDKTLKASELESGKLLSTLVTLNEPLVSLAVRPGGSQVVCGGEGRTGILFDAKELKEVRKFEGQPGTILTNAFSADGKLIAFGGSGNEVRAYQVDDGARKGTFRGHKEWIYALAFRPGSEQIATAGYEGIIRIYGLKDEKEIRSFVPVPLAPRK